MSVEYKTNKNVYILGAGFSVPAGIPTIASFFDKTKEVLNLLDPEKDKRAYDSILRLLEFRYASSSAAYWTKVNLDNIEELFSFISAMEEGYGLIDSVVDSIAITIDRSIEFPEFDEHRIYNIDREELNKRYEKFVEADANGFLLLLNGYQKIVSKLLGTHIDNDAENSFITFNYDTILEETLSSLGVGSSYHLGKVSYETDWQNYEESVSVLKLHGSINWGFPGTRGSKLTVYKNQIDCFKRSKSFAIIPPTWNKQIYGQTRKVWIQAINELRTATRIVFIGFSFPETDNHVKYLLSLGLRDNISLRNIIFINPMSKNEAENKLSNVFSESLFRNNKIKIIENTIESFINGFGSTGIWNILHRD